MTRRQFLDSLLLTLLLIFVVSLPIDQILIAIGYSLGTPQYNLARFLAELILRMLLLLYYVIAIQRSRRRIVGYADFKMILLFLPLLIVVGTNMYLCFFFPEQIYNGFNVNFVYDTVLTVFTAIIEEIVFRFYIHNALPIKRRLVKIIASAGIFSLLHGLSFLTTLNPFYLIQMIYTFGLGIILGFIMEYGKSIVSCMIYHFLFNFVNTCIFTYSFKEVFYTQAELETYELCFIGNAVIVGAIAGIYLLLIYLLYIRKKERNDYYTFDVN